MIRLFKPGYEELRGCLEGLAREAFDEVLEAISESVPSYWDKRWRERTLNLVMAEWLVAWAESRKVFISRFAYLRAAHMAQTTRRFNDGDLWDGISATSRADEILVALEDGGFMPPPDS